MALTVGVATVLDSREVVVVVTGLRKALALSKAIGKPLSIVSNNSINTLLRGRRESSCGQLFAPPNRSYFILKFSVDAFCSPAASLGAYSRGRRCYRRYIVFIPLTSMKLFWQTHDSELRVKTVKYFKSIERVQVEVEKTQAKTSEQFGCLE